MLRSKKILDTHDNVPYHQLNSTKLGSAGGKDLLGPDDQPNITYSVWMQTLGKSINKTMNK